MIIKISPVELAKELVDYCGTNTLMRYSNYPGIGINPSLQTGNNWVNGIFFTTLKYYKPDIKSLYYDLKDIKAKYIIIATINSSKIMDRKDYSDKEFNEITGKFFSIGYKIAKERSLKNKEGLRQAFLNSGIEVLIGGHCKTEVTVFKDNAVTIEDIYEIVEDGP